DIRSDLKRLRRETDSSRVIVAALDDVTGPGRSSASSRAALSQSRSVAAAGTCSSPAASAAGSTVDPSQSGVLGSGATGTSLPARMGWKLWAPVAAVVVAAISTAIYMYAHRTPMLAEKDSVIIADFANTTGDPVFDGTLRQGLSVQLEQSPYLNILSDAQIAQTVSLMGH